MSNRSKLILASLPFVFLGVVALLIPKIQERQKARVMRQLETTMGQLESTPLKSVISRSGDRIISTRQTFSINGYGVTDVGNLRLAFEDRPFSGNSSGYVTLATDSTASGEGGSTGLDNGRFEAKSIPHGTRCKFGGTTFEIIDAKLDFGGKLIDVTGSPSLVLIGASRQILEVTPLKTPGRQGRRAEQVGARQPATAPDPRSEGNEKPNPDLEGRSQ